ncbi:toll/interleukin-1 receptor domain-containing protein [Lipingzhangella sp. LS1_29]|uniref:Toll/interleukin-1 receptor domain-containing protein n=1 Tax=Lipingzhangella rawalii TaxID=2055835 RepID=A0ABU2HCE6_9ACTN|nr:toll/interleukin-1 receptor domain-containing protein [Lipingzhangella rawalii]MDS1272239.1 toll/interleukin-1 receptor domain-containing protein [Lipingzhangella rawalii]
MAEQGRAHDTGRDEEPAWDVFVSYARRDIARVRPLVAALRAVGLSVFTDDTAIGDFAAISHTIRTELARSRLLLVYYSTAYPRRRACQWELTVAFLAAQRIDADPRHRILVVNPEAGTEHIHPVELRDSKHAPGATRADRDGPRTHSDYAELAHRVRERLASVSNVFGAALRPGTPRWTPAPARAGSTRFTGRLVESWQLHSALHPHPLPLVSGRDAASWAVVRGPAGIGKTLLVEEYALRFATAYPGGVFWLSLAGAADPPTVAARYRTQLADTAAALDAPTDPGPARSPHPRLERLLDALAARLGSLPGPFLWVVDDVPDLADAELTRQLRAPHPQGRTVFTTRSRRTGVEATAIDLDPLPEEDALRLLTPLHEDPGADSTRAARTRLAREVGHHPLALDLLGRDPYRRSPMALSALLYEAGCEVLSDIATEVPLPTGYPSDIAQVLLGDVLHAPQSGSTADPAGDSSALDALRCAVACDPVPVTVDLVWRILSEALAAGAAQPRARSGIAQLHRMCVLAPQGPESWRVTPLTRWALQRHDPDPERSELLRKAALGVLAGRHETSIGNGRPPSRVTDTPEARMPQERTPAPVTDMDRMAAFEIQMQLVTRVGIQRLGEHGGILREALGSLHTLLELSRDIMRRYNIALSDPWHSRGSDVEQLVDELINDVLRPFLERWHPALAEHEASRPAGTGAYAHECAWPQATQLRAELDALHDPLSRIARDLGEISGSSFGFRPTP